VLCRAYHRWRPRETRYLIIKGICFSRCLKTYQPKYNWIGLEKYSYPPKWPRLFGRILLSVLTNHRLISTTGEVLTSLSYGTLQVFFKIACPHQNNNHHVAHYYSSVMKTMTKKMSICESKVFSIQEEWTRPIEYH
jgi:hypothetical protein